MTALVLDRVAKRYVTGGEVVHALDGVSFSIAPGELVAVCGPSGSGKSTLLLIAAALIAPDSGTARFGHRDLSALTPRELADYRRHDIGLISQTVDLFPGVPALDNAAIKLLADRVPMREARAIVRPWLERVGLGDRLRHTPDQLSGGERARVAVARAIANGPKLLLADEPTANLDTRRGVEIVELLAAVARENQTAALLVTHDREAAAIADRVEVLRDGRLTTGHVASVATRVT